MPLQPCLADLAFRLSPLFPLSLLLIAFVSVACWSCVPRGNESDGLSVSVSRGVRSSRSRAGERESKLLFTKCDSPAHIETGGTLAFQLSDIANSTG